MHLLISWLLNAAVLLLTAYLVPGFHVANYTAALLAAIALGVINTFIRPVLLILTAPLNILSLGLFTFVVNAVVIWLATLIVPGFTVDSFWYAIVGAVVLSFVSTVLSHLFKDLRKI